MNESQLYKTVFSHLNAAFTFSLEVPAGFDRQHAYPYVSSTGRCSAFSFIQNSLFSFSFLYNAFSGVIEDKVKDDLKETVSYR